MDKIINIISGFLLGLLMSIWYRPPYVYHGPNSNDIRKQIFNYNGKCYRLEPKIYVC